MALAQDDGPANAANGATIAHSLESASPTTVGSIPPATRPVEQVFATLAAAPPDFSKLGDHAPDATAAAPNETRAEIAPAGTAPGSAATIADAEPIKGPIPLPRPRPAAEQAAPAAPVEPAIQDQHGVH